MDIDATVDQITALARDYLAGLEAAYEDEEITIGVVGIAYELRFAEGGARVGYSCSDGREWIHAGLFREALRIADREEDDD